jgi:short subunit dehydrogenase-like uncharacterized protein
VVIVDACVSFGTHYVDITGETPWVKGLIDRYHAQAASEGTRIIPCCGFDSIPSDLGTYLVVRYLKEELGVACRQVKAYFQAFGGFNGGTLLPLGLISTILGKMSRLVILFCSTPLKNIALKK